jgi:hypothetical protein
MSRVGDQADMVPPRIESVKLLISLYEVATISVEKRPEFQAVSGDISKFEMSSAPIISDTWRAGPSRILSDSNDGNLVHEMTMRL